ncbi:hypothetical protein BASA82_001156 [Batrachochytrium salamandrivorans]|uniref:Mitochondrial zinc maintenance protein 1, mitochondrial n=1 Tax=Batrachochytrium salamandrivorans TaxID=1357716 RepID=A0ABQ8F5N1_9FUNG|nr:hypothetical protein BASA62_004440 [Batrachochytrium salamandrivorans]KAH6592667.1 hypothetical protein BASA50_007955 [Batrachochytrium salamandrivorans]KAH6602780.1 hypothetical protein BASA61_000767 [Batrachochytrium salamandrivorans]KAH9256872.1 hypothetical protein BASA81_004985 [Batrachochytrium salamandrivorans]KAH9260495.1 hypothetical protein BASA82_001156 [Batrachochytrium salamandrivorans]
MASTAREALGLYRQYIKEYRRWPKQEQRRMDVRGWMLGRLRTEFRQPASTATVASRLEYGRQQLTALRAILDGTVEAKYLLKEDGPIRAFMPAFRTFTLLDQPAQEQLSEKNTTPWTFIGAYLAGQLPMNSPPSKK